MYRITCKTGTVREAAETETLGLVTAGEACTSEVCGAWGGAQSGLARINFPIQEYTEGFCPAAALEHGTMFPGLVL